MKRSPTGQLLETPLSEIKEKMLSFLASFRAKKKMKLTVVLISRETVDSPTHDSPLVENKPLSW